MPEGLIVHSPISRHSKTATNLPVTAQFEVRTVLFCSPKCLQLQRGIGEVQFAVKRCHTRPPLVILRNRDRSVEFKPV